MKGTPFPRGWTICAWPPQLSVEEGHDSEWPVALKFLPGFRSCLPVFSAVIWPGALLSQVFPSGILRTYLSPCSNENLVVTYVLSLTPFLYKRELALLSWWQKSVWQHFRHQDLIGARESWPTNNIVLNLILSKAHCGGHYISDLYTSKRCILCRLMIYL